MLILALSISENTVHVKGCSCRWSACIATINGISFPDAVSNGSKERFTDPESLGLRPDCLKMQWRGYNSRLIRVSRCGKAMILIV